MYDTVAQYRQVLSNEVDDWHPPVMVRLWQLLRPLAPQAAPMFALQAALYMLGFGLLVAALARKARWKSAIAAAALGLSPLLLGWQMVVLKDAQMLGALVAAVGIAAHYRLQDRNIPFVAAATMALLIGYATLVRANAVFVTAPLAVLLLPRPASIAVRGLAVVTAVVAVLAATPLINHRLLDSAPSEVANSQPVFDLAAIAVSSPASPSIFTGAERSRIERLHCVKAFFWDPLGDPTACSVATGRLMAAPEIDLYRALAAGVAAHPFAYARHRLQHWNSTERWLVEAGLPDAAPPIEAEPNDLGLETPSSALAAGWQDVAAVEAASPLGWPVVWTVVALCLVPIAWRRRAESGGGLALALVVSGLSLEASFFIVSIASDLRYHLWPMLAAPLALILLSDDLGAPRRQRIIGAVLVIFVIAGGVLARSWLPRAPDSYEGMIHAATG
jgi:hypothetical protein